MASTQQKTKPLPSKKIEQKTLLQTGTWSTVFPKQQNTETQSRTFVKKLMAVAISNITYLRAIFPENVFSNRSLDGLSLKILKEEAGCKAATSLIRWIRGAFEALEKRYLRELILVIYLDPENPDQVYEMYTFRFKYSDGDGTECQLLQGTDLKQVHTVSDDNLYCATRAMLQNVTILVQGLGPLPDSAFMSMKLTYYDEITPCDYEPQGFCPTDISSLQLPPEMVDSNCGEVSMNFHALKVSVKAIPRRLLIKDSQTNQNVENQKAAITNNFSGNEEELEDKINEIIHKTQKVAATTDDSISSNMKLHHVLEKGDNGSVATIKSNIKEMLSQQDGKGYYTCSNRKLVDSSKKEKQCHDGENSHSDTVESSREEPASLLSRETEDQASSGKYIIKCVCNNEHPDNLMLTCNICKTFQHGACYRIVFESDIPGNHICVLCSIEDNMKVCTDRKLAEISWKKNVSATCLFRRALACLLNVNVNKVSVSYMQICLGIDDVCAEALMAKLLEDKILIESSSNENIIDRKTLQTTSFPKYLGIRRYLQGDQQAVLCKEVVKMADNNIDFEEKTIEATVTTMENKRNWEINREFQNDLGIQESLSRRSTRLKRKRKASAVEDLLI